MTKKSEIPFGAQFSPNQVDLPRLLGIMTSAIGSRSQITQAIRDEFFASHAENQRWKLADNTVLALRAYKLLDDEGARPTPLALELYGLVDNPEAMYERFARHLLTDLRGTAVVETLAAMQVAGGEISLHTLGKGLEQRGMHVPRGAVHLSSLRLWLAKAGIFDEKVSSGPRLYEVNHGRLKQVLGVSLDVIDQLTQLNG
ncbi:MAG: hypothetical protein WBF31_20535, partial [Anaerolineae bacterium]